MDYVGFLLFDRNNKICTKIAENTVFIEFKSNLLPVAKKPLIVNMGNSGKYTPYCNIPLDLIMYESESRLIMKLPILELLVMLHISIIQLLTRVSILPKVQ